MIRSYKFNAWVSLFAVALASQACTVTTGTTDDEGEDDDVSFDDGADAGNGDDSTDDDDDTDDGDDTDAGDDVTDDGDDDTDDDGDDEADAGADDDSADDDADAAADDDTDDSSDDDADAGADDDTDDDDGTDDNTEADAGDDPVPTDKEYGQGVAPDFECERDIPDDAVELSGTIDEDTTLSGTLLITNDVRATDIDLIIEPGTRFIVDPDSTIDFGWNGNATRVIAEGTEDQPITFCGTDEQAGSWADLTFGSNVTSDSTFKNVLIHGAGGSGHALILEADVLIENVVVAHSGGHGVSAADFNADSTGLFITDSSEMAGTLTAPEAVTNFPKGGNISGNAEDFMRLTFAEIDVDTVFHDLGVPYLLENDLRTTEGSETTYEAGVVTHVSSDSNIEFGWNGQDATLVVAGLAGDPVVFRGEDEDPGYWRRMVIRDNVRSNSSIQHMVLQHAGADDLYGLLVLAAIPISDLTLEANDRGVFIESQGLGEGSERWTISGTVNEPLGADISAVVTLPPDSDFSDNDNARVEIDGSTYDTAGTIPNVGIPYMIRSDVTTREDAEMTIAAGVEFIMGADTRMELGWNGQVASFNVEGTEEAPVRFTALDPVAGYWEGIIVRSAVTSGSAVDWMEVHHAGGGLDAALILQSPIEVTNSVVANSDSAGIQRDEENTFDYAGNNSFVDNAGDDVIDL